MQKAKKEHTRWLNLPKNKKLLVKYKKFKARIEIENKKLFASTDSAGKLVLPPAILLENKKL